MSTSALHDWIVRRGAELQRVEIIENAPQGRGVRATADIAEGETVMRVPQRAMITLDVARRSPSGRALLAAGITSRTARTLIAAYLLDEKRRGDSPIAPYLHTLPASFPTVPVFCPDQVLPHLTGSLAATLLVRRREALLREVLAVRKAVHSLRDVSITELFWASTAVVSRVFGIKIDGAHTEALVPFADMMNHKRPADVSWAYEDSLGSFVVKAVRDIAKGDEICTSYGRKANHRYFIHYGFALERGADDEAGIRLTVPHNVPRRSAKISALYRAFGNGDAHRVSSRLRGDAMLRTLSFVRTACASDGETARALRMLSESQVVEPLSQRNETAALTLLKKACWNALDLFESPHEDGDNAVLGREDLPDHIRYSILVRRGEKRLLRTLIRTVDTAIPLLGLPRRQFFSVAASHRGEALTSSYLFDVAIAFAPRQVFATQDNRVW